MYAHFDFNQKFDLNNLIFKLNSFLDKNIVINNVFRVHNKAHARFDATLREYKYFLTTKKDVFSSDTKYHFRKKLNFDKISLLAWPARTGLVVSQKALYVTQ